MTTTIYKLEILIPKGNSFAFLLLQGYIKKKKNQTYTNPMGPKSSFSLAMVLSPKVPEKTQPVTILSALGSGAKANVI